MKTTKETAPVDVLAVMDRAVRMLDGARLNKHQKGMLASQIEVSRGAVAELVAALRDVLKHEKWHAAMADIVTDEAVAAIKRADAALARIGGAP
jgi:hypothetical protein